MLSILFFHPSLWSNTIMRKAYVIRPAGTEQTAIRVKLTAYKPARPVTLERFLGCLPWYWRCGSIRGTALTACKAAGSRECARSQTESVC